MTLPCGPPEIWTEEWRKARFWAGLRSGALRRGLPLAPPQPEPLDIELPADGTYWMVGPAAEFILGAHVTGEYEDCGWTLSYLTTSSAEILFEDGPLYAKHLTAPVLARVVPCGVPLARKWQDGYGRWQHKSERAWCPDGWTVADPITDLPGLGE